MNWISLLKTLLNFTTGLTSYLGDRQLIQAGERDAILQGLRKADEAISKAKDARANALREFDDGLPADKDDIYKRD